MRQPTVALLPVVPPPAVPPPPPLDAQWMVAGCTGAWPLSWRLPSRPAAASGTLRHRNAWTSNQAAAAAARGPCIDLEWVSAGSEGEGKEKEGRLSKGKGVSVVQRSHQRQADWGHPSFKAQLSCTPLLVGHPWQHP